MQTFLKGCKCLHLCSEVSYQFPRVVMLILRPAVIQTAMSQQDLISSQILGKKNYLWMDFLKILLYFLPQGFHLFLYQVLCYWSFSIFGLDLAAKKLKICAWKWGRGGGWDLLCSVIFVVKLVCSDLTAQAETISQKAKTFSHQQTVS